MNYSDEYVNKLRDLAHSGKLSAARYHSLLGMFYGYKQCCVKNYVNMNALGIAPAGFMSRALGYDNTSDHVLCVMCHEKWDRDNPDAPRERPVFVDPATGLDVPDDTYAEWRPENQAVQPKVVFLTNTFKL